MEKWKDVFGYNGLYKVSNAGRVISLRGSVPRFMTASLTKKGYLRVTFHIRPILKQYMIHRLVAQMFIPNPMNLPEINHKDGNKKNNNVDNIEWCTSKENSWHKFNVLGYIPSKETKDKLSKIRLGKKLSDEVRLKISISHKGLKRSDESIFKTSKGKMKQVIQYDKRNNILNIFQSLKQASIECDINKSSLSMCCSGKRKTAGGFIWRYV